MQYDAQKMRPLFEIFKKIDAESYPFSFAEFWRRKVRIENVGDHILSEKNIQLTYGKLSQTLKTWQWNRPYEFSQFAPGLKAALANIADSYDAVRKYSLLEFHSIPEKYLRVLWNEMGAVKDMGKNGRGLYLAMAATKPLMFLWGQTLAFDSIVRRDLPKFGVTRPSNNNWTFEDWKEVMNKVSLLLNSQLPLVNIIKEICLKEYNTDSIVPYGQFMDLYIWANDPKRNCA
jgi:hypothetical protein